MVELRERSTGEHLLDGAGEGLAGSQIDDGIDHVQDGIDVVGDHDDGSVGGSPAGVDEGADGPLLMQVERDQRLVAQQQLRVSDQCLPDPEPLLFPTGQVLDPAGGEGGGVDGGHHLIDRLPSRPAGQGEPEPVAVEAKADEIAPP